MTLSRSAATQTEPFWQDKRVLVTGGNGFLGQHVMAALNEKRPAFVAAPRSDEFDLTRAPEVADLFTQVRPNLVLHLAASVGGIGANSDNPGRYFYDNAMMSLLLLEQARKDNVDKIVGLGSICSYPNEAPVPFKESDLWNGYPEETNAPYGLAKKMMLVQGQAYRKQYGMNIIHLLMVNLYGPGDNFDLRSSHVIAAILRRCIEARRSGANRVRLWGTGTPTREFLYVRDAADAILRAAERYDAPEPINIGTGSEITIRDLAEKIARICGFTGAIEWDASKPDGQPRRALDISRQRQALQFEPQWSLDAGLRATLEWYLETHPPKADG